MQSNLVFCIPSSDFKLGSWFIGDTFPNVARREILYKANRVDGSPNEKEVTWSESKPRSSSTEV